ncbi:hypothetical protein ACFXTN_026059 [Malus domestica]
MIFKIDGLFFQLHSSLLVSSGRCGSFLSSSARTPSTELTVKTAFFSACFFCTLSPHTASFFGSTATVGDEYSRAVLGVDEAKKDWRLFDIWDRRFDKLPVISAKLSLRVTGANAFGKDWRLFDIWDLRFNKLSVIPAKLSLRVTGANASGKARCFSDF